MPRNPTWHRDELILALDLYLRYGLLDDLHDDVIELSEVLNRLSLHTSQGNPETFRNPNGVSMKMANLAALDTNYRGTSLMQGGRRDAEVWDEFTNDRERLTKEAAAIRARAPSAVVAIERPRHYWALQANPKRYRIEDAVREKQTDWWKTNGKLLRPGDRVMLWKSQGGRKGAKRGVVGLGEVVSEPALVAKPDEYWTDPADGQEIAWRAEIRYVHAPNLPLWLDGWAKAILEQLTVSQGLQRTAFDVTTQQWEAVVEAAGGWPEESPEIQDARDAIAQQAGRKPARQGFRMNVEERRAIEQHAMEMAKAHYHDQGWTTIDDVSLRKSYDLHCSRSDGSELRVEVKGTTGMGDTVLLTPNEVTHAHVHHPNVALFIVANITLSREEGVLHTSGGDMVVHEPWKLKDECLKAIGYEYAVPRKEKLSE